MSIIREHGRLTDSWAASHDNSFLPEADAIHEPHHALSAFGVTADSPLNTWTAHKKLDGVAARWKGKRLDYVLYRGPARPRARKRRSHQSTSSEGAPQIHPFDLEPRLHCTSSKVAMTAKVPGMHMSLSDHFAVEAVLSIQYPSPSSPTMPPPPAAPSVWDNGVNITGNGSGASPSYRDNDHTVHLNGSSPPLSSGPPSPTSPQPSPPTRLHRVRRHGAKTSTANPGSHRGASKTCSSCSPAHTKPPRGARGSIYSFSGSVPSRS